MGIFDVLIRNYRQKSRTLKPLEQSLPQGYRGALNHDVSLCTGCHTCASVCSPGAIQVEAQGDGILWRYQTSRCSFCARCEQFCPTGAIQLGAAAPTVALSGQPDAQENRAMEHHIEYKPCSRCGKPMIPLPGPVLARLVGSDIEVEKIWYASLCEKCRPRVNVQRFKDSLTGSRTGGGK